MKKYRFYAKINKTIQKENELTIDGIMSLYTEGQKKPIHEVHFEDFNPEFLNVLVDSAFQDYIHGLKFEDFMKIKDPELREVLKTYFLEKKENKRQNKKTYFFLPKNNNPNKNLEFLLVDGEYKEYMERNLM